MEETGIANNYGVQPENAVITIPSDQKKQRRTILLISIAAILLLLIIITAIYFLLTPNTDIKYVARLRDVFIILMAFESLLIGVALIILIIQITRLINLMNNEIKPILDSTSDTVNTLRGTTTFLSNNFVEPVIKANEYLAGIKELLSIFRIKK